MLVRLAYMMGFASLYWRMRLRESPFAFFAGRSGLPWAPACDGRIYVFRL